MAKETTGTPGPSLVPYSTVTYDLLNPLSLIRLTIHPNKHSQTTSNRHDHAEEWGPLHGVLLDRAPGSSGERLLLDVHAQWLEETDVGASEAVA